MDNIDADEPDSSVVSGDENVHLRQICSRLRRDLKQILLLSTADCQVCCRPSKKNTVRSTRILS